ncbi:MAG: hypothetical protein AAFR31_06825 [Cyanobacteria bacterium J06627_8]
MIQTISYRVNLPIPLLLISLLHQTQLHMAIASNSEKLLSISFVTGSHRDFNGKASLE